MQSASRRRRNEHVTKGATPQTKRMRSARQPPRNDSSDTPSMQLIRHTAGPQRHPITFPVKEIFCPQCSRWNDEPCWSHTTTLADQDVLPYAVASLPQALYLGTSTDVPQIKAIFARTPLPAQTVFGPLVGDLVDTTPAFRYALRDQSDQNIRHFDLENDKLSNWMKFVRFAETAKERNVAVYVRDEKLYFVTTRKILLKEELKVGYSSKYANLFGFSLLAASTESGNCGREEDTNQSLLTGNCPYPEPLLPGCLPVNEDPADVGMTSDQLDMPLYSERNWLPYRDNAENLPNAAAEELRASIDAVIERNHAILQEATLTDHPNSLPSSVENSLLPPVVMYLINGSTEPSPVYPEPALDSPSPVVDTSTDYDGTLVDSTPAGVKKPKRRRRTLNQTTTLCELCGTWFSGKIHRRHMLKCHRDYCNEHWTYQCIQCLEKWPTKGALSAHITKGHPNPVTVISHDSQAVQEAMEHVKTTGYLTYNCRSCRRHYPNKALFDLDQLRHRAKDSLEQRPERCCPCCSYVAKSFDDLMEHCVIRHSQDADSKLCIVCGRKAQDVRDHMMEHHAEIMEEATKDWRFKCDECDHRFFRENNLLYHKETHNDAKSGFQCLYCAKVIYRANDLATHAAEHNVNGQFKCPCCEKTFPIYSKMRTHYRDSHDIKSLKPCEICQVAFRTAQRLKFHMQKVHMIANREEVPEAGRTTKVRKRVLVS